MEQKELIEHLQLREKDLIKELEAIRTLLDVYTNNDTKDKHTTKVNSNLISSKGSMRWEDYAFYILKQIGGKAKAYKVVDAAINANPNINEDTLRTAIKAKLSKMYLKSKISAIKGKYPKDGYTYEIKKEPS